MLIIPENTVSSLPRKINNPNSKAFQTFVVRNSSLPFLAAFDVPKRFIAIIPTRL